MSYLTVVITVAALIIGWELRGLHDQIKELREEAEKIREEISDEYTGTGDKVNLMRWGIKNTVEQIRKEVKELREEMEGFRTDFNASQ